MSEPTNQQKEAIQAQGAVLLSAGAGTGKTATLVSRCVRLVTEANVSVDELLVVTFTNAAAAEMKQRLREALQEKLIAQPGDQRLHQQLLLLEGAHISTIHAFCLELIRAHFTELGLDPGVAVLEASLTRPLENDVARQVVTQAITTADAQALVAHYFGGDGERLAEQIRKTHQFYVKQPYAGDLLAADLKLFAAAQPDKWREERAKIFKAWLLEWQPTIAWQIKETLMALPNVKGYGGKSPTAEGIRRIEAQLPEFGMQLGKLSADSPGDEVVAMFQMLPPISGPDFWVRRTGNKRGLLKKFFEEAAALSLWLPTETGDPLDAEWQLVRLPMQTLLALTQAFARQFSAAKRALGGVDFSDLEQLALQLLQDEGIAEQWRQRFKHVFVDECQDINAAQDALIQAVSYHDDRANLFMVGDVKQSIYRFRMAAPKLFRDYAAEWKAKPHHQVLALNENFRSRAGILAFANDLFGCLMGAGFGGVEYGASDRLQFGQPKTGDRSQLSLQPKKSDGPENHWPEADCRVELHLVDSQVEEAENGGDESADESGGDGWEDLLAIDQQARVAAGRLRAMMDGKHQVWNKRDHKFHDLKWSDVGLLLRAVSGRAGAFLREFRRQAIPLVAEQGDFLTTLEAQDLTALLQVLDNPHQDIPLFAVLRSPLVGLSLDELVVLGVSSKGADAWSRLEKMQPESLVGAFSVQLARWRRLALVTSLSCVLETVLVETRYEAFLLTLVDGLDRVANVRRFLDLARRYDPLQRQGLQRFLRLIAAQQAAEQEIEPLPPRQPEAVQLMSVHKSKGLEFPVVVLAGIGSRFNQPELKHGILFSRSWGLAPQVVDVSRQLRQDSLVRWLVRREEQRESVAEELRLLYVAITRARDTLLLVGSFNPASESWVERTAYPPEIGVARAKSCCEWIGMWLAGRADWSKTQGEITYPADKAAARLRWQVHAGGGSLPADKKDVQPEIKHQLTPKQLAAFSWNYANTPATQAPGKTSASALRRLGDERDEETTALQPAPMTFRLSEAKRSPGIGAAGVGTAHHKFLQHVKLAEVGSETGLAAEAKRLSNEGILTLEEAAALELPAILAFWQSALGAEILQQDAQNLRRELPLTAAFDPAELSGFGQTFSELPGEFVVVQGAVDLAVILAGEIWIVDFKTDRIRPDELTSRTEDHAPQLRLYAAALARIYKRPVRRAVLHFLNLGQSVEVLAESQLDSCHRDN